MPSSNRFTNSPFPPENGSCAFRASSGSPAVPRRVLIIDDEAVIRELVSLQLGLSGYDCMAVPDGQGGLELARHELFDLIVLDLLMPGLDGISVCRAIRRDTENSE